MTFLVNDGFTGTTNPLGQITIVENADGSLTFTIDQLTFAGAYLGDLRGLFFDLADETLVGSLSVTSAGPLTEVQQADDSIRNLGQGANINGLLGSDGGYDVGIEIGTNKIAGSDDVRSFTFTLSSSLRFLTLDDFANVDFGLRITSVGVDVDGNGVIDTARTESSKIGETTFDPIDANDDLVGVVEEDTTVAGNVLDNDTGPGTKTLVSITHDGTTTYFNGSDPVVVTLDSGAIITTYTDGRYQIDATGADGLAEGQQAPFDITYSVSQMVGSDTSTDEAHLFGMIVGRADAPFEQHLVPEDLEASAAGGFGVDVSGNHMIVGAPGADGSAGQVTIYERNPATGTFDSVMTISSPVAGLGQFGFDVAINESYAVVGAPAVNGHQGAVYVFEKTAGAWGTAPVATLLADIPTSNDYFGYSVAIDGERIVVGTPFDDDGATDAGSTFVFELQAGEWVQTAKLTANSAAGDGFGGSVDISGDHIVVGAQSADIYGSSSGVAYVFALQGEDWSAPTSLLPIDGADASHNFGEVAIDGNTIVIGAHANSFGGAGDAAYVYELVDDTWQGVAILRDPDLLGDDGNETAFGQRVDISGDLIVVGDIETASSVEPDPDEGSAYVYQRTGGVWNDTPVQELSSADLSAHDQFGAGIAIDGTTVVVGAYADDTEFGTNAGSVYVFNLDPSGWYIG
jgi:hypothetical protein